MPFPPLDLDPLTDLCDALTDAGVPAALDPSEVNTPGAWVHLEGITTSLNLAGGHQLRAVVHLIVGDRDTQRALEGLTELYTSTLAVLTPDAEVTVEGVILPGDPTPLPALRVPVNLT